jgi:hypothetical protein
MTDKHKAGKPVNSKEFPRRKSETQEKFDAAYDALAATGGDLMVKNEAEHDNIMLRLFGRAALAGDLIYTRSPTKDERKRYGEKVAVYFHKDHPRAPRFVLYERCITLAVRDAESGEVLAERPVRLDQ